MYRLYKPDYIICPGYEFVLEQRNRHYPPSAKDNIYILLGTYKKLSLKESNMH